MTEERSPEQQRRQTSSMASPPVAVGRACSDRRPAHTEETRSKAASSYALPCPPDSRRRLSRDALSKSLGDYRYMAVPATGRASCVTLGHYPQVAREAGLALSPGRGYGPPEVGNYYIPEHPYVPGYVAFPAMGSYDWKQGRRPQAEPTALGPQDNQNMARQAMVTQVGMMHQAGDVAGPTTALAAAKQQGSPESPGEKSAESDWSPTKELMKEDARSAIYYAGTTASEGSSEHRDKRDESSGSSISSASSTGSSDTSAESEPQKMLPPVEQAPLSQHLLHMQQMKMQDMHEMQQQMQQIQQKMHQLQQMRQHMHQQQFQQHMHQLQQPLSEHDDMQKLAPQQAPRLKDPRAESTGLAGACDGVGRITTSVAPVGPPPGYFARPARETGSHTKQTESRSQFSVVSLAAPLLPASAASLANRSAMEQACILVNVVLLSVLTGIVAAFLVRQLT